MNDPTRQSPLWRWRQSGFYLALFAALFSALVLLVDTFVLKNVIVNEHPLVAILTYLTIGGWVGVLFNWINNRLFAQKLDPTFTGEYWLRGKSNFYAMTAGVTAALGTFFYFFVAGKGDPSVLIALSTVTVVWLAIYDGAKTGGKRLWLSLGAAALVCIGAALIARGDPTAVAGAPITLWDGFLVTVLSCGAYAVSRIYMKKLALAHENMVNVAFWRFLWLAVIVTLLAPLYARLNGVYPQYLEMLQAVSRNWTAWLALAILMSFQYVSNTLESLANNYEGASTIAVVKSAQTVLAIPLTLTAMRFMPGLFSAPSDPKVWLVRLLGVAFVVAAIWFVPKEEKK